MRKLLFAMAAILVGLAVNAQTTAKSGVKIYKGGICLTINVNDVDSVVFFGDGSTQPGSYEAIDLGLPSGLKWASCNIGATQPEQPGSYFAWGETQPKQIYDWDTYKWCNGTDSIMTKYVTNSEFGHVDNLNVLQPEDDAAHVNWGGAWRMPTKDEFDELIHKCKWTLISMDNGSNVFQVTGPNGNSIMLPIGGYKNGGLLSSLNKYGNYWTSNLRPVYNNNAISADMVDKNIDWMYHTRQEGYNIRPVTK